MDILGKIVLYRAWLRYIARQKGNDRCWIDDHKLYWVVLGVEPPALLKDREACLQLCWQYFRRRSEVFPPTERATPAGDLDADLVGLDESALKLELQKIIDAVTAHYEKGIGRRTAEDDRCLVAVLPEDPAMDQRVPDDLIDGPVGCVHHLDTHFPNLLGVYPTDPSV